MQSEKNKNENAWLSGMLMQCKYLMREQSTQPIEIERRKEKQKNLFGKKDVFDVNSMQLK